MNDACVRYSNFFLPDFILCNNILTLLRQYYKLIIRLDEFILVERTFFNEVTTVNSNKDVCVHLTDITWQLKNEYLLLQYCLSNLDAL
jgi:hypothetical protein